MAVHCALAAVAFVQPFRANRGKVSILLKENVLLLVTLRRSKPPPFLLSLTEQGIATGGAV
jgi:hypothetical protein